MNNVWVGTDWHLWSVNSVTDKRHQFRSISNLGRLSDAYAEDIQSDDIFIYLGDLCDPGVTDIKKLKAIVSSIPGYKVLCKGNHDTQDDTFYKEIGFDVVCEICVIHNLVFSHKPVRVPMGYLNIHGHLHTEKMSTLGYQHINAYDSNFFERPMLVDDLIDSAAFQSPEEYAGTDLKHVEEKFEKYTSVENDTYTQIVDLTDMVGLYPVDEAVELPTFKTPEDLSKWMKSNVHYANFTKLKSSDGVAESKSGSCHDQVVFEYNALKNMGKKPKILFFIAYKEGSNQGGMTHSLVYYNEGSKVKWFENSWSGMEGIHTYDSLSDLKADIKRIYSNMPDAKNFPELEFKSASISDFDTGMNLGEFVSGIMDEAANDPLDEVLFSDITDVQYWENDDDAPKKKKVKQSPLDTDDQGVVAESTTAMNTFPFIFLSQENMDDELYPEGKMLLRNMDDAVRELYLYQRPAGEYYVHNTEPGYYRIIMSPEFSAGYFSTDTINLSAIGKIRVNADYSWEWIEKYDSGMNEAIGQLMTEAFFPGAGISLHYAVNNIQKTSIQEIKSLIKSNKLKGLNPKPYSIEKNTIIIELVGGSQDERESHKTELAVIAKELKDVLTVKYSNEVKTVTNGDGDEGCIYIKLKKNVDMTINETTNNKFSAAKSSLKVNTSLYFISKDRLDETEIIRPRIPDNYMTQHGYEDNKTPRVCFSTSIDGCLTALGMNVSNQKFYVYQPISDAKVITPTEEQVPDVKITKERWICEPVQLHYIGAIKAIDENGPHDDGEPYRYGKNKEFEARLYHWGWKWLNRPATSRNINESASDPVTLYHGSPKMFKIAKAHDSGISGEHLFATSMRSFALAYAGAEWNDFEINQSRVNGVMYLTEILPGKFREIFNRPGYIHILPADSFKNFHGAEYISDEDVRVKKTYKINNVLKELQKAPDVKLYYYPDLPPFIQDRERYLRDLAIKYNHDADKVLSMAKELRVEAMESNNPNDGQSSKAVELTFYLGNDKVGEAAVSGYDTGAGFLYDLEVVKRFRGKGYSKQILDYVMKNYSVTDLSVADDNKVAISLYEKFGFKLKKAFNSNGENGYEKGRFRWYQLDESASAAVEDTTELHEMSPKDKQAIANKYGLRTPGEYQQDGQDKTQERVNQRREKQLKDLKKARKIKKRKAFVRKVKSHLPGAQNESAMGILSMPKVVFSPPFDVDDKVDLYVGLANKKINEYEKTAKNIPVPKRKFKKNPNKNRAVPDYYLKLWFNPDRATNLLINDAAPNQHTIWLYPDEYCTLMFVCADDVCRVYMLDSYIAGDYYQFLGSFQVDMGIGARLKAALKEDSSGVDDSESDHYEADATDRDPLWGDRNHFFKHPNAAEEDYDKSIQENYKFELVDKNLKFVDRLDEATTKSQKLYPVYVVLVHSGTGVSKAIKAISHSEYSHASICFDSSLDKMYSFARKDPRNPFIGGFRYESIGKGFYEQKEIPYAVYVVPCTENQIKKMKKRLNYFIQNQEKFTFDFTGLVTNYLGIVNNPAHRWFCSRFVADVLNAGAPKNNPYVAEPSLQDPDDFKDTDWAIYVDSGENLMKYDRKKVDRKTNQILRKEMLRRMTVNESAIFDLDAFNPFIESTLNYQFAMMDEAAVDDFVRYLKSFKVKFDKEGNVIISRREVDQLDKHFRQSLRMIKAYENAGDLDSVKLELCKINYMIELINEYYLSPKAMKSKRVKADLRKEMLDLRSVMLNAFSQHLKYVKTMDPAFNFKSYYDTSIYGKNIEIPKPVLSAIGKAIVTRL